jgi:nicotinate-nucleotide--dimethylbenzimidazole phosphoribosyltransferase
MAARRDIRRFRPDPVPAATLARVLEAAHTAPSVGHSQPWRFVIVQDPATRAKAAVLADRARLAQAELMDPESARQLLDLDLEGIREAPLAVVVCCDRRAAPAGVLGRATFVEADMWSCACAIQNLWLAARAEGLGVGWVTLFEPADLADLVGAPDGVSTLGWLCVGWPDERPPSPGLERRGWSERLPVDGLVMHERWADGPAAPRSRLQATRNADDLPSSERKTAQLSAGVLSTPPVATPPSPAATPAPPISMPPPAAVVAAHDTGDWLLTPPGSLGILDRALDRLLASGIGEGDIEDGVLVLAAADHPVTSHGVSAYEPSVTRTVAEAAVAGTSVGVVVAQAAGLDVVVVDAGIDGPALDGARSLRPRAPRGDLVASDALSAGDASRLVAGGRVLARELIAAGARLFALGEVGVGNTTVAAALTAGLLGVDAAEVVGLGAGADSAMVARKRQVVEDAVKRAGGRDPFGLLAALGGGEVAVLTGVVLGAVSGGAAVVLDGLLTSVAALVAVEAEPGVASRLVAGQRSREVGHQVVLRALGLEPLLDLRFRAGEGVGAAMAVSLLKAGIAVRMDSARTEPRRG